MTEIDPTSVSELQEVLRGREAAQILGLGTRTARETPESTAVIRLTNFTGVIDLHPSDLVCAVQAGTSLFELQSALAKHGLCIPTAETAGTVGGAYMAGSVAGTWRDWTIGATFMLSDGTIAKSGSHAVKSVAGYDVHRFMAGTRGSLAICLELILRVYPISAIPAQPTGPTYPQPEVTNPTQIKLMKRAKQVFDPTNKLNPGEWGFM